MAEYSDREAFIPLSRQDLVTLCLKDQLLTESDRPIFESFCEILSAYCHFDFHAHLETLKHGFAHLDPDRDLISLETPSKEQQLSRETRFLQCFRQVLKAANYSPLNQADIQEAFEAESLLTLDMQIDFDDFEEMIFYWRGSHQETHETKKLFWKKSLEMEVFERVILLIKFKDEDYFKEKDKKTNIDELNFQPGKTYIYLYKKIPKWDLEVLFPNVQIHMTWKDKVMFMVPAVGAAIPMVLKALPQLVLIVGVLLFFAFGPSMADNLGVSAGQIQNFLPVLLALLSLAMVFGSFAFKQFLNYKNKKLKFLKGVTDTLFFKNLACNAGVFHSLIDAAEEERCKEMILAYYHLLTATHPLSEEQLDNNIEAWLENKAGVKVDFNVHNALEKMSALTGPHGESLSQQVDEQQWQVLGLEPARTLIDRVWDHIFDYNR